MPVFRHDLETKEGFPGVFIRVIADHGKGSLQSTLMEVIIKPGAIIPHHFHLHEEIIYILEGRGSLKLGDDNYQIDPSSLVIVPPQMPHSLLNDSQHDFILLSVYGANKSDRTLC